MANHPNRNWRRRWSVDQAARTATHLDGWAFIFAPASTPGQAPAASCIAHPSLVGRDLVDLQRTVNRIAREAVDIYADALQRAQE